jgi:predicted PurR-regulated permease PerM
VLVSAAVVVAVAAVAIALWKLRVVLALLLLGLILGCAVRPFVDWLAARGLRRSVAAAVPLILLAGVVAGGLTVMVPPLLHEARGVLAEGNASRAAGASGLGEVIRQQAVTAVARWLASPSLHDVLSPALELTRRALAVLTGIAFVFAIAAYWTIDRDRIRRVVTARLDSGRREAFIASWDRVEQRMGRYVRAQLLLISFVAAVLSTSFMLIGLPYWLLLGVFAGVVEIIPVVGPLAAGALAVGIGLTVSTQAAALAAVAVYGLRLVQDYVIVPRVIGHAVDLPPLLTLVWVAVVGIAVGPALVPLATPVLASVTAAFEDRLSRVAEGVGT